MKISRRKFVGICGSTVLLSVGIEYSGYLGRILDLNQSIDDTNQYDTNQYDTNQSIDDTIEESKRTDNEIRFIIVGDPHVKISSISNKESERLKKVVDFINKSDVDFVIFLGDMADTGIKEEFEITKNILANLEKSYRVIAGNHDIRKSREMFESYFGPMEHAEKVKGYQLIFVGIDADKDNGKETKLKWSFDFNNVDKDIPTLVFNHGPVIDPPSECIYCNWGEDILGYGKSMKVELDKFTNIIGVISGHVHYDSDQTVNETRHITINGLTTIKLANMFSVVRPSNKIGYVIVKDDKLYYKLVSYRGTMNGTINETIDGDVNKTVNEN